MYAFLKRLLPNWLKGAVKRGFFSLVNPFVMRDQNKKGVRKLNIGSSTVRQLGFLNIDIDPSARPDIVRDIEKGIPFDDSSVDEIRCSHVLEHIRDLRFVLQEFYRVCKNGAKIIIVVPLMDASDMTHVRLFDEHTFRTLTDSFYWDKPYYFVGKYKELSRSFKDLSTCREMTIVLEVIK